MHAVRWMTLVAGMSLSVSVSYADDDSSMVTTIVVTVRDCRMEFVDRRTLSVERPGVIEFVTQEGRSVDAETVVVRLRDDVAQAALALAEHEASGEVAVEVARKAAEAARHEYIVAEHANVTAPAGRTPPVPIAELTRLRLAAEQADLEVEVAEHELETYQLSRDQSQAELETYRVVAPAAGVITRVYHRAGESVQQGEPILELVPTETIRVEGRITLSDAQIVSAGMPVQLFIGPVPADVEPTPVAGVLGFVDVSVIQSLQEVRVWADVPNTGNWKAGIPCEMEILVPPATATVAD